MPATLSNVTLVESKLGVRNKAMKSLRTWTSTEVCERMNMAKSASESVRNGMTGPKSVKFTEAVNVSIAGAGSRMSVLAIENWL